MSQKEALDCYYIYKKNDSGRGWMKKNNKIKLHFIIKSLHWNPDIREKVTEALCSYEERWTERILRRMTYDLNWSVKINAVESLGIGRELKSLRRLKKLTNSKDELIRTYAYVSLIDVVMNRTHDSEIEGMLYWLKRRSRRENSDLMKLFVVPALYGYGYEEAFIEFQKLVNRNLKMENICKNDYTWRMIHALEYMSNDTNHRQIEEELRKIKPFLNNVQKNYIETEWNKDM